MISTASTIGKTTQTTTIMKKLRYNTTLHTILLLSGLFYFSNAAVASIANTNPALTFPSLPTHTREAKFEAAQQGFEERSNLFLKGKHFQNWSHHRPQKEIFEEFKKIEEWRNHSWYTENTGELLVSRTDFMVAQDLLEKGYYRHPNLIAFQYNQTDGSYNSSLIVLNGQKFLALEAPTDKNIKQFYKLLQNFCVTQLVRLTPATSSSSYPYWQGRIKQGPKTKSQWIQIPLAGIHKTFPIRYYATDAWQADESIEPVHLLKLIQAARKAPDSNDNNGTATTSGEPDLLACHCENGVGKTGTFIAGYVLLQEIDRQIAAGIKPEHLELSIEKVVMQLSLQRLNMVASPKQYLALYRLVDSYIQSLKKNP